MVLQRTLDNLRERPKHEREAVAFWIAVAVVLILFLFWGVFFFRNISTPDLQPVNAAYTQVVEQISSTQASPPTPETTGWVSSPSQSAGAEASQDVQIIQENSTDTNLYQ